MQKYSIKYIVFLFYIFTSQYAGAESPYNWQMHLQDAASPIMEDLIEFHKLLLYITISIVAFVFLLLFYACVKFRRKRNPNPSTRSHHILIEIIWTVVPVLILAVIAIPSLSILVKAEKRFDPDMTIKVVGHQWYWEYNYPDHHDINFDSYIIKDEDLKPGQLRLLEVDNRVIVPVNTNVKILVTSYDVIHSWAVPALGITKDAVPGRVNETWFRVTRPGVYYGQCSEICGIGHGFMPIAVQAVSKEEFNSWVYSQYRTMQSTSSNTELSKNNKNK